MRRRFTNNEIVKALKMVKEVGMKETCHKFGIHYMTLRMWCKKAGVTPKAVRNARNWEAIKKLLR